MTRAQIFLNGLRLGGRFDNHQHMSRIAFGDLRAIFFWGFAHKLLRGNGDLALASRHVKTRMLAHLSNLGGSRSTDRISRPTLSSASFAEPSAIQRATAKSNGLLIGEARLSVARLVPEFQLHRRTQQCCCPELDLSLLIRSRHHRSCGNDDS